MRRGNPLNAHAQKKHEGKKPEKWRKNGETKEKKTKQEFCLSTQ